VVLSELIFTVAVPCVVVKVKVLPLILVSVPLAPRREPPVRGDVGGVAVVMLDVATGVGAGAQDATAVINSITSRVTAHINRCFNVVPPIIVHSGDLKSLFV
jgi:hypothetical protein